MFVAQKEVRKLWGATKGRREAKAVISCCEPLLCMSLVAGEGTRLLLYNNRYVSRK